MPVKEPVKYLWLYRMGKDPKPGLIAKFKIFLSKLFFGRLV